MLGWEKEKAMLFFESLQQRAKVRRFEVAGKELGSPLFRLSVILTLSYLAHFDLPAYISCFFFLSHMQRAKSCRELPRH
jgi:hypothetical protein